MIFIKNESVDKSINPYWFVKYTYDGDALSDYQSTILVQARDEKSALAIATKEIQKDIPDARYFEIDKHWKLGKSTSLDNYKKLYPHSNTTIINESVDSNHKNDYSDPKYLAVLRRLIEEGFNAKFLGDSYLITYSEGELARLECLDTETGFVVNLNYQTKLSSAEAAQLAGDLGRLAILADEFNAILSDATTVDTKDRHINESVIQNCDANFGRPGNYILYRNGADQTQRGLISFSDTYDGADIYASTDENGNRTPTKKYLVRIKKPFLVVAQSSLAAFKLAYYQLSGKHIGLESGTEGINEIWRFSDKIMSGILAKKGYDSLIYKVPQCNEVLVVGNDIKEIPAINEYFESVKNLVE